jgi:hypothetical protein
MTCGRQPEPPPGVMLKTRGRAGGHTLQAPPKPMLIVPPSTRTGTWRLPWVSCNISSMAWGSLLTSR